MRQEVDVVVVGGGINGAGIARDLAGRGLKVMLVEQHDLGGHTSSASTKLIHGGLRYLEHFEFMLVRKSLAERELLMRSAPHIMWPLRFVMPHDPHSVPRRPVWMIRLGLFLYDHLARREWLPGSQAVALADHVAGACLKPQYRTGFVYSDGWVDDARLVVLNAVDAAQRGAQVLTRWRCTGLQRMPSAGWSVGLEEQGPRRQARTVTARAVVNAAGPWAADVLQGSAHSRKTRSLRLVKGSHIVVPALFGHDHAYIFQNPDRRIIFAIPYEGRYTLIGTTDVDFSGDPGNATIDAEETRYLCEQAGRYFRQQLQPSDVVWSYSGVRPLLDEQGGEASAVTRDYLLEFDDDGGPGQAPLLTVWGGKITTFRKLAEEAADLLMGRLQERRAAWTAAASLPGGDLSAFITPGGRPDEDFVRFVQSLRQRYPALPAQVLARWARQYGSLVDHVLKPGEDPGQEVAPGVFEAELRYLHDREWARSADDVLWRRTKLGLHLSGEQRVQVQCWWTQHLQPQGCGRSLEPSAPWN